MTTAEDFFAIKKKMLHDVFSEFKQSVLRPTKQFVRAT